MVSWLPFTVELLPEEWEHTVFTASVSYRWYPGHHLQWTGVSRMGACRLFGVCLCLADESWPPFKAVTDIFIVRGMNGRMLSVQCLCFADGVPDTIYSGAVFKGVMAAHHLFSVCLRLTDGVAATV